MIATPTDVVLQAVEFERFRQEKLVAENMIPWDAASVTVGDAEKLAVLMEEVGEVAREINEGSQDLGNIYTELIQVAAVAVAWAEAIHELQSYMREASVGSRE